MFYSEIGVSKRVSQLVEHPTSRVRTTTSHQQLATSIRAIERRSRIQLAEKQREGVLAAVQHKVAILTGGPGTGKTTTLRTLLDLMDSFRPNLRPRIPHRPCI